MIKAVIYARYSSHNQREESLEGQIRECTEYATRNGYEIIETYCDSAISGRTENRDAFQRMIKDSDSHQFEAVIMYAIDRFARDRYTSAIYKNILKKNNVKLLYAKNDIPDSPEGILLESLMEGLAEYYSENLARGVKRGMTENALKGFSNGGVRTFGYDIVDKKYVINDTEAEAVRTAFAMYLDGYSCSEIADRLNSKGLKNSKGSPFKTLVISRMLFNPRYIGTYSFGDTQSDTIPAIVDKDVFYAVQKKKLSKKKAHVSSEYLLSGRLYCANCNGIMTGETAYNKYKKSFYYYICPKKNQDQCGLSRVSRDVIEGEVFAHTLAILDDDIIELIASKTIEAIESSKTMTELERILRLIEENKQKIANLSRTLEIAYSESVFARTRELEQNNDALQKDLIIEQSKSPEVALSEQDIANYLRKFKAGLFDDDALKKLMLRALVYKVEYKKDMIRITYNITKNEPSSTPNDSESIKVRLCSEWWSNRLISRTLYIYPTHFILAVETEQSLV